MISTFHHIADAYDRWYEVPEGRAVFHEEIECLRLLGADFSGRRLEVGVGTGRFADTLGITHGVDLSPPMAVRGPAFEAAVRLNDG